MALRQRADLLQVKILPNKISLPQGQNYTERKYLGIVLALRKANFVGR